MAEGRHVIGATSKLLTPDYQALDRIAPTSSAHGRCLQGEYRDLFLFSRPAGLLALLCAAVAGFSHC